MRPSRGLLGVCRWQHPEVVGEDRDVLVEGVCDGAPVRAAADRWEAGGRERDAAREARLKARVARA